MRAISTSVSSERSAIVGVRSGIVLNPKLVAELRAVAARPDIAQRVLAILEPGQRPGVRPVLPFERSLSARR